MSRMVRMTPRERAVARDRIVRRSIDLHRPNPLLTQREREEEPMIELVGEVLSRHAELRRSLGYVDPK